MLIRTSKRLLTSQLTNTFNNNAGAAMANQMARQYSHPPRFTEAKDHDVKNGEYTTHPTEKVFEINSGQLAYHKFRFVPGVLEHYHHHMPLVATSIPEIEEYQKKKEKYSNDDMKRLEELPLDVSRAPKSFADKIALYTMRVLRVFVHAFFRERYHHHSVTLETVAAVPPMVASMLRHFESLRRLRSDNGWVHLLLEEAENERMHLMIWLEVTKPTFLERLLIIAAQIGYTSFYTTAYLLFPSWCHRLTGYLEEEATASYTSFLNAIDKGALPNGPAPEIAKRYYHLKEDATIRDVVLCIRADEMHHRDWNHQMADKVVDGKLSGHKEQV